MAVVFALADAVRQFVLRRVQELVELVQVRFALVECLLGSELTGDLGRLGGNRGEFLVFLGGQTADSELFNDRSAAGLEGLQIGS